MSTPVFDVRRPETARQVEELLHERRQVWANFCDLGSMKPFAPGLELTEKMQAFCQILIDYISLGHFGVYRRIIDGSERRRKALETAEQVYPAIEEATDMALAFNDKYEAPDDQSVRVDLEGDLSRLGEALATRFDLEDQLLSALMA
jgi:regulator of sigma D